MGVIERTNVIANAATQIFSKLLGSPALGAVAAIMAAFTSNGKFQRFYNQAALWSSGNAKKITATAGGTATDIKNVGVIVIGTDFAGAPLTETLPLFTLDTPGTVTSVNAFKTITSIEFPAHDGTGATTSVGVYQGGVADVLAAQPDKGVNSVFKTATIVNPAVGRNITATAGGTNTDVKAIQPIINGLDMAGVGISETLPAFTVDTTGTVVGNKAFASITYIDLPAHDGVGATTSFGTGAKLGLPDRLSRNSVRDAYLNGVREGTPPTVTTDAAAMSGNTVQLASALNGTPVSIDYAS